MTNAMIFAYKEYNLEMGLMKSKEAADEEARAKIKELIRARNRKEVQQMYGMIDESVTIVRNSQIQMSVASTKQNKGKISNLNGVIQQLLQSFKMQQKYLWGQEIYEQFKKHFKNQFEEMWALNKEEFYKIILANCHFQTLDFQKELQEINQNQHLGLPQRNSYQEYFYQVGAAKLEHHLPSSIISDGELPMDAILQENCKDQTSFNINAINATIINHEFHPEQYEQSHYQKEALNDNDFLPLFISPNKKQYRQSSSEKKRNKENHIKQKIREARIQNSSLVMPETVFLSRLNEQMKQQIGDLVAFYRQFGNALQRMFFSVSLLSAPFKHFMYLLTEELQRKNIKQHKKAVRSFPTSVSSLNSTQKLLYSQNQQAYEYRERRQKNNDMILDEIKDFTEAYTEFIWKYLELHQLGELKLGRLISIEAVYGIVLKSVWSHIAFISQRGFQYEEWKLQLFYQYNEPCQKCNLPDQKKRYLLRILKKLEGQHNPQRYLKKVVIFYRQASVCASCADDLLYIYQNLIFELVKSKKTIQLGLFRMRNVIQKILKIDEANSGSGEIGYGWISWCITIEFLKGRIYKSRGNTVEPQRTSKIIEPTAESYFPDQMQYL